MSDPHGATGPRTVSTPRFADAAQTERLVAETWERVLHQKSIDRDADFRTLGINSNRAMQIIREIWEATGVELPINSFFVQPTIRLMAAGLRDGTALEAPDVVRMRDGREDRPLFLFPGGGGVMIELVDLVAALDFPGVVYAIGLAGLDGRAPLLPSFEAEASRARRIIGGLQTRGPYRVAGYSIGGIVALETARLLALENPAEAMFVGLLDTPQNDHSWPLGVWLAFMTRKLVTKLQNWRRDRARRRRTRRTAPPRRGPGAAPEKRRRGTQFEYRFRNPNHPDYAYYTPYFVAHLTPKYERVSENVCRLKGRYKPARYDGPVFFFASERGDPLVCDPQAVWPPSLPRAEWIRLPGNHLSMMMGRHARTLAREISDRIRRVAPAD